ncbi:undecaprenyl-phosphate glucose phosphotransferase [Mucilaginibacter sp.]|uniref:undecaprenyl-phosphate glucose phosphotransferase n=1 Tax=Mucilaginibacter sp. TaxID=1882438 RepID=UPI00261728A1|nr:undecaprenyl-phosphate glucose phosphotransferase [Mucilaginibacter sp.]MDB4925320.1 undecaprenyl-phosphate glucose phosphotransferase [Mucilaginibacter sp.]
MQTRYLYLFRFILALSDLLLFNICLTGALYLTHKHSYIDPYLQRQYTITANLIWFLCAGLFRLYSEEIVCKLVSIYRATYKSVLLHGFLFLAYIFFTNQNDFPRFFIAAFYGLMIFGFLLSRFTGTALEDVLKRNFNIRKSVAVLGMNNGGIKLAAYLEKQTRFNFLGFLGDESSYVDESGNLIQAASMQLQTAAHSGIKDVFVSLTPDRMGDVQYLLNEADKHCVRLKFVPDLNISSAPFDIEYMDQFSIISLRKEPLKDINNRFKKRLFDIVFSSLVIVFILSWLYPILALIIKMQSPGPVLFKQLRSGRDNEPFWCYKFRSMQTNNADEKKQASRNDNRVTKIGSFMRRTSLDELPQFFNVLLGNMSVMGPRPHMLSHTEQYRTIVDKYMVRQFLKPGITGWAQVNGFRGETKETYLMEKRVEHDIWYMEHWSIALDIKILFMTIINVIKGEDNAY